MGEAASFLLAEVLAVATGRSRAEDSSCLGSAVSDAAAECSGGLTQTRGKQSVLPGLNVQSLRSMFAAVGPKGNKCLDSDQCFGVALACLEDLRLLVPFPCIDDFYMVPAHAAAPYCLQCRRSSSSCSGTLESNGGDKARGSKGHDHSRGNIDTSGCGFAAELVREWFGRHSSRMPAGRHWHYLSQSEDGECADLRQSAASFVAETSLAVLRVAKEGSSNGCVAIAAMAPHKLVLPASLIAPAAWIDSNGALNMRILRFAMLSLLQVLWRSPGCSAPELAQQAALLETCEVELLLSFLAADNLVEVVSLPRSRSIAGGSSTQVYYSRLMRQVALQANTASLAQDVADCLVSRAHSTVLLGEGLGERSDEACVAVD